MAEEAGLFVAMDVAMPPRPRPRKSDRPVMATAAQAFAEASVRHGRELLGDVTADEFAAQVLSVMPCHDHDGMQLAEALSRKHGYQVDLEFAQLTSEWSRHESDAHAAHVATWVRETRPTPPFEDVARVRFDGRKGMVEGAAYRTARDDARGTCCVVPDDEANRYVRDGAFAGGYVVDWERVEVVGPATEAYRKAYEAMLDAEARAARARELSVFTHAREVAFEGAVDAAVSGIKTVPYAELGGRLSLALAALSAGPDGPDPLSGPAAEVVALLRIMRVRSHRVAFEAAATSGP